MRKRSGGCIDGEEIVPSKSSNVRSCRDIDALAPNDIEMSSCSKSPRAGRPGHRWGHQRVATSTSLPPLMFFVHALLSFVGVVVIPSRLSYELLLGPSEQDALSAAMTRWTGRARPGTLEHGATISSGANKPRPEVVTSFHRKNGGARGESTYGSLFAAQGPSEGAHSNGHNTGYGGRRVLSQTDDDDDRYTYSSVTTFSLCFVSNFTDGDALKSALEKLFEKVVTPRQADVTVSSSKLDFCSLEFSRQWDVEATNNETDDSSAASISADQMNTIRNATFLERLASSLEDEGKVVSEDEIEYTLLGYYIVFDSEQEDFSSGLGNNFKTFFGPDQYWPWWAYLIVAIGLVVALIIGYVAFNIRPIVSKPQAPEPESKGSGGGIYSDEKPYPGSGMGGKSKDPDGLGEMDTDVMDSEFDSTHPVYAPAASSGLPSGPQSDDPTTMHTLHPSETGGLGRLRRLGRRGRRGLSWGLAGCLRGGGACLLRVGLKQADASNSSEKGLAGTNYPSEADRAGGMKSGSFAGRAPLPEDSSTETPGVESYDFSTRSSGPASSLPTDPSGVQLISSDSHSDMGGPTIPRELYQRSADVGRSGRSLKSAAAALDEGSSKDDDDDGDDDDDDSDDDDEEGRQETGGGDSGEYDDEGEPPHIGAMGSSRTSSRALLGHKSFIVRPQGPGARMYPGHPEGQVSARDVEAGTNDDRESPIDTAASATPRELEKSRSGHGFGSSSGSGSYENGEARQGETKHLRAGSQSSFDAPQKYEPRELTDEERQLRRDESDAARAASVLRAASTRVPMHPDLVRATTDEQQDRRRRATLDMDKRRVPLGDGSDDVPDDRAPISTNLEDSSPAQIEPSPAGISAGSPAPAFISTAHIPVAEAGVGAGKSFFGTAQDEPVVSSTSEVGVGVAAATAAVAAGSKEKTAGAGDSETAVAPSATVSASGTLTAPAEPPSSEAGLIPTEDYSLKVDRGLKKIDDGHEGGEMKPMSLLIHEADQEDRVAQKAQASQASSAAPVPAPAPVATTAPTHRRPTHLGLPPPGPSQAAALALQHPTAGLSGSEPDLARLTSSAEEGAIGLDDSESVLASPIVATPPALLRPGVGPAARGAAGRGRGHILPRPGVSGSFVSTRSSVTEEFMSNALTEDDMSSGQTTDVSRTSSYHGQGSFEDVHGPAASGAAAAQAGAQRQGGHHSVGAAAAGARASGPPMPGGESSLAEQLARVEDKFGREYEKGMLYREGAEGVGAAYAGEVPRAAAGATAGATAGGASWGGAAPSVARGVAAGSTQARAGQVGVAQGASIGADETKVEDLAGLLALADDGPGNIKALLDNLDESDAKRLEELNARALAEGDDPEARSRLKFSLAELYAKADQRGTLRDVPVSESAESAPSEGAWGHPEFYNTSASSQSSQWGSASGVPGGSSSAGVGSSNGAASSAGAGSSSGAMSSAGAGSSAGNSVGSGSGMSVGEVKARSE